jgi:hypothetical protein
MIGETEDSNELNVTIRTPEKKIYRKSEKISKTQASDIDSQKDRFVLFNKFVNC